MFGLQHASLQFLLSSTSRTEDAAASMGNTCSFSSPDLERIVIGADGHGAIPTFAVESSNSAFLSASGSFIFTSKLRSAR